MVSLNTITGEFMEQSAALNTITAGNRTHRSALVQIAWIVGFSILTAVGAQVQIPIQPVPITLQTFFVLLSGVMLGARNGAISQALYLCAGLAGMPVFAGLSAGPLHLIGPTGGYLLSFPAAALIAGALTSPGRGFARQWLAVFAGSLVIFLLGTIQLKLVFTHNWGDAFRQGFLIFSWWDAIKVTAVAAVARSAGRILR
jgi:biotin transport system substrate-specific component